MLTTSSLPAVLGALAACGLTRPEGPAEPLPRLDAEVSELAPGGRRLAVAAAGHQVLVLDVQGGEVAGALQCGAGEPVSIAWRPDGAELAVLDHHGFVRLFEPTRTEPRLRFATASTVDSSSGELRVVSYAGGGSVIVTSLGAPAELFDARDGARFARIAPAEDIRITALDVSADGEFVALGDEFGRVAIWSVRTGRRVRGPLQTPRGENPWGVQALSFHPDGSHLAVGSGDCTVRIWTLNGEDAIREYRHCDADFPELLAIRHLAYSDNGRFLAATTGDGWMTRVWDTSTHARLWTQGDGCGNPIRMRANFTPDAHFLVTEFDGVVTRADIWKTAHRLEPPGALGLHLRYRAAGAFLWASAEERFVIWRVDTGRIVLDQKTR